jgi:hypothetical protein
VRGCNDPGDVETPDDILDPACCCLKMAMAPDEDSYIRMVVEVISEMKEPLRPMDEDEDEDAVTARACTLVSLIHCEPTVEKSAVKFTRLTLHPRGFWCTGRGPRT